MKTEKTISLRSRTLALAALSLPLLTACSLGQMGNCGAFCGGGKVVRSEVGAPPENPRLGKIFDLGGVTKDGYWVWSRATIERIGELPGQPKLDARLFNPQVTEEQARGSNWFSITWGSNELDPKTGFPLKTISPENPSPPPGLYRLTSQVSFVDDGSVNKYLPFQGQPRTTIISVEAGKTTVLSYRTGVDATTSPITAWVDVVQLPSSEALPRMYKHPNYLVSPRMQVAEPPGQAHGDPAGR
ncbi:MAG: hypothetical protein Q4G70_09680 [Pseudomonadota bacterium]|nr:hypothetical protein [Pseudomonadota bacterium]